ncbi:hypothetical protein DDQ45_20775 [Salmonella enterica]|nr:hypothetical protein [Salmonella enterica]EDR7525031.1 hypothetical protein [Salmonella enterica subsp. enterica serovar Oranienburg]EIM5533040.1 hypothetical protein [Salmonella enterica subsp. enterica]
MQEIKKAARAFSRQEEAITPAMLIGILTISDKIMPIQPNIMKAPTKGLSAEKLSSSMRLTGINITSSMSPVMLSHSAMLTIFILVSNGVAVSGELFIVKLLLLQN